jgi:DNA modification methylase
VAAGYPHGRVADVVRVLVDEEIHAQVAGAWPVRPYLVTPRAAVLHGDSRDLLKLLRPNSVDAIVTDPPYGLSKQPDMREVLTHWLAGDDYRASGGGFMGKTWDSFVPGPALWRQCYEALKPGGHLLAFFGTRTYDLGVTALRLAGFEVRDMVSWLYGQGFPKSLDISKAIDDELGTERKSGGTSNTRCEYWDRGEECRGHGAETSQAGPTVHTRPTLAGSPEAEAAQGWGTALKPACEPIVVARKPLDGTYASNFMAHGTGGLNIDGCRIEGAYETRARDTTGGASMFNLGAGGGAFVPARLLDAQTGERPSGKRKPGRTKGGMMRGAGTEYHDEGAEASTGGASRFFFCAKAAKSEKNAGCTHLPIKSSGEMTDREDGSAGLNSPRAGAGRGGGSHNPHPTVKPIALMRWLCRLVTPRDGLVLDPFAGSGSTGVAALAEGFQFVGVEMTEEYLPVLKARIEHALKESASGR